MKKEQVTIGEVYAAKITDKVVPVRIDAEHKDGGWTGTNTRTNRKVRIKTAQKLRNRITPGSVPGNNEKPATRQPVKKKLTTKELERRSHEKTREALGAAGMREASNDEVAQLLESQANHKAAQAVDAIRNGNLAEGIAVPRSPRRAKRDGMSCLDAAAKVLAEAGEPMNTKAMVEAMARKGYWTTDAPTPSATLYSGILRELQKKGDASRFTKVERGKFTLAKGA